MRISDLSSAPPPAALALSHPFESGALTLPASGRVVALQARPGPVFELAPIERWACQQSFKPFADALTALGVPSAAELTVAEPAAAVFCLPPRQRDEARALLADALARVEPGGLVVAAMANDEGARSGEADLRALISEVEVRSKHRCRVFWCRRDDDRIDHERRTQWQALDTVQPILDGRYVSRPGLFAWDRIDPASALLAAHLPPDLAGHAADFGAGWGYLAIELASRCPQITSIDLYEAQARALEPMRINLQRHHPSLPAARHWHDVSTGVPGRYDLIISNPPFHQDRADRPDLGQSFIAAAAAALNRGGQFWLVANRHLPYEAELAARFAQVRCVAAAAGFKVLQAVAAR